MEQESSNEIWQVEANGQIFETTFEEMTSRIEDGSLLRIDRVRRGNLRWIEAGKVPALSEFFDTRQTVSTSSHGHQTASNAPVSASPGPAAAPAEVFCSVHADAPVRYICDTCSNSFCKACPSSYGANVKICPFCGAMCRQVETQPPAATWNGGGSPTYQPISDGTPFGPSDVVRAFVFPFKHPLAFVFGSVMFAFFSVGQSAASIGGIFLIGAALVSYMLSNMLTFGVLAHTIDSFVQGKINTSFMPSFDDFGIWDDVVHPFFLSLGAYISSFLPLFLVAILGMFVLGATAIQDKINEPLREQATDRPSQQPVFKFVDRSAEQSKEVRQLVDGAANTQRQRLEQLESGVAPQGPQFVPGETEEESLRKIVDYTEQQRKQQLESVVGKTSETVDAEREVLAQKLVKRGGMFLVLVIICFAFGCIYFPAACAVAGYTRSLAATLNPSVVFDTIRHLGASYLLVLAVSVVLLIAGGLLSIGLSLSFGAFDLPGVGNLPAKVIGSFITFYLWIVWSATIGYAMYRKADRFQFAR